jgi:hypothetical protein
MSRVSGLALFVSIVLLFILSVLTLALLHSTALSNKIALANSAKVFAVHKARAGINEFLYKFKTNLQKSEDKTETLSNLNIKQRYYPISQSFISARYFSKAACKKSALRSNNTFTCHYLLIKSTQFFGGKLGFESMNRNSGRYEHIKTVMLGISNDETIIWAG